MQETNDTTLLYQCVKKGLLATACRLNHLVVMTIGLRDVARAKTTGEIVKQFCHLIGSELPITARPAIYSFCSRRGHGLVLALTSVALSVPSVGSVHEVFSIIPGGNWMSSLRVTIRDLVSSPLTGGPHIRFAWFACPSPQMRPKFALAPATDGLPMN